MDERSLEFGKLAGYLDALASPARLELLHMLREPRGVTDIELRPAARDALRAERNITRQGVRKHLAKLEEAGLVTSHRARRGSAAHEEYVVNHAMLFALTEELRRVTRLAPTVALPPAATMTGSHAQPVAKAKGARLVMVHGAHDGRSFALDPRGLPGGRGWVLGRRRGLPVSLDHDPFISQEHAEVVPHGDRFELLDLRTNKNGTELNWEPLPRGGSAALSHGDVIGLGRTLLLFRVG